MTDSVMTQAQLLALFADGQAIASIPPASVRDLILSIGYLALNTQAAVIYDVGSVGGTLTLDYTQGSIQRGTLTLSTACAVSVPAQSLGTGIFCALEMYLINNSSGNGTLTWPSNVTWVGSSPQPIPKAGVATKLRLESIDGGQNWSVLV
jgi:hypothetical protein